MCYNVVLGIIETDSNTKQIQTYLESFKLESEKQ